MLSDDSRRSLPLVGNRRSHAPHRGGRRSRSGAHASFARQMRMSVIRR